MTEIRCIGCGALVPDVAGPCHAYMLSVPSCWQRYCSLEDWKAELSGQESIGVVQDLVDSFAVQHAASTDHRNTQSVAVHLMSLCAGLERRATGSERRARIGRWVRHEYPVLSPAPGTFAVTIPDVAVASLGVRQTIVSRLAQVSWSAWAAHHDTVRSWLDSAQ